MRRRRRGQFKALLHGAPTDAKAALQLAGGAAHGRANKGHLSTSLSWLQRATLPRRSLLSPAPRRRFTTHAAAAAP